MLYCEESVKANIRNRNGKRVFYLGPGDNLTPSARDWLRQQRIEVLGAEQAKPEQYVLENGAVFPEKPEHYTHLRDNILVPKTHPVIAFRGAVDTLEAELLLSQLAAPPEFREKIGQVLQLARNLIRWDVMQEPAQAAKLCALSPEQLREHSHRPQDFYGQPHFIPAITDGAAILQLNRARTAARAAELAAVQAFVDENGIPKREDLLLALNRMSSMLYILMIQLKASLRGEGF